MGNKAMGLVVIACLFTFGQFETPGVRRVDGACCRRERCGYVMSVD
jgi:hypothetical protein